MSAAGIGRIACAFNATLTRYSSCFSKCEIHNRLVSRMEESGIRKLTDIQEKVQKEQY